MKYKVLELLKTESGYISGEGISKKLGISRSAVWKDITSLRKDGYEIDSVPSKGYKLEYAPDRINPEAIKKCVPGKVYYFDQTSSTSAEAKKAENVPDKSVFIAETQTDGRGRLGRKWTSPKGSGIWMSIYITPDIPMARISQLTLVAGMAVCRAIEGAEIKWPNDVILGRKKISGILTEMTAEVDRAERVIIGIGVNVNTETFNIDLHTKATSVYLETGKKQNRSELINDILSEFWSLYDEFIKNGFGVLRKEYIRKCATLDKEVLIVRGEENFTAKAVDIADNGELIIEKDGIKEALNSGEVSVRGLLGYI